MAEQSKIALSYPRPRPYKLLAQKSHICSAFYERCLAEGIGNRIQNMKSLIKSLAAGIIASTAVVGTLHAGLITGNFNITGQVTFNASSVGTATSVISWVPPLITGTSTGSFTNIAAGTSITFANVNWNLNTSTPITNYWTVGGFRFELLSSSITFQSSSFLLVSGTGIVSGNGYTPTKFHWAFSSQDPSVGFPPVWTFAASCSSQNTNGQPILSSLAVTNATILSWTDPTFTLQAAPNVTGPYTNVPGAISPYTNSVTATQRFFRLNQ